MDLGLLDILATQQVDKTSYAPPVERKHNVDKPTPDDKSFREYLDNNPIQQQNNPDTPAQYVQPIHTNNPLPQKQQTTNFPPTHNPQTNETLSTQQQIKLTQVFTQIKNLQDTGLLAHVNPLQPASNLSASQAEILAQQNTTNNITLLPTPQTPDNNILNPSNTIQNTTPIQTASANTTNQQIMTQLAEQGITLSSIANKVIEIAKADAQTPNIDTTDVKSDQISSLLGNNKKDQQQRNTNNNTLLNEPVKLQIPTKTPPTPPHNNQTLTLAQQITNQENLKTATDTLEQNLQLTNSKNINQTNSENFGNNPDTNSNNFKHNPQNIFQEAVTSDIGSTKTTDFIKFQQHVNQTDQLNSQLNQHVAKVENIISQIKFGISSVAGNNNQNISIQLNPRELGNVDIRMEIGNDGKTRIAVMAENTDTLNLLQKESASLKDMLQDALKTESTNLSFSFHEKDSQAWKEMIQQAFNNKSIAQETEEETTENLQHIYSYPTNLQAIHGIDINV